MQVLLIIPTFMYKGEYPTFLSNSDFPVGFAYLASALRNAGHKVLGLNPNNDPNYSSAYEMLYEKIQQSLKENQPGLIGMGGLCTDFQFLKDTIQIIRNLAPDIPIVCGGGIVNNDKEFIFQTLRPDFCISGDGEEVLVQLVRMLESSRQDYEQINNLGYWKEGISKFTRENFEYTQIDRICFPDYEPFGWEEMLGKYQLANRNLYRYTKTNPRVMPIVAARGCPFKCTFCVHEKSAKYRGRYRVRSIENIIQELSFLYEQYHFNILVFLDELFAINKSRLREFCITLINARKTLGWDFDWTFQTHANASINLEDFKLAKEAGCYLFSYGLESGSPKVLASMKKKTKPSQIAEGIKMANSAGIGYAGNFIFGDIAETVETISESMEFFSQHCLDNHLYFANIQPYPGSKIFDICMERGIIKNKLKFYKYPWKIYNMTSIPDVLWIPWMQKMLLLGRFFLWVKSTDVLLCTKEIETANNPMVLNSGKLIWNVLTKCPYCNDEVYFRELLGYAKEKQAASFWWIKRHFVVRIIDLYRRERKANSFFFRNFWVFIFKLLKRIVEKGIFSFLSFFVFIMMHPIFGRLTPRIFKLLKPLISHEEQVPNSFVTGCPSCNKRFRASITSTTRIA